MAMRPSAAASASNGRLPGHHLGDQPRLGTGERAAGERGQQAGLHDRRLADARRADDDQQTFVLEDLDHLADGVVATVEVVGVGLLECGEAAIRVAGRHERSRGVDGDGERVPQICQQVVHR